MDKYHVGIVDEDELEVLEIKRTIIANKPDDIKETDLVFNVLKLEDRKSTV